MAIEMDIGDAATGASGKGSSGKGAASSGAADVEGPGSKAAEGLHKWMERGGVGRARGTG